MNTVLNRRLLKASFFSSKMDHKNHPDAIELNGLKNMSIQLRPIRKLMQIDKSLMCNQSPKFQTWPSSTNLNSLDINFNIISEFKKF
jgi:hypothetical protein